MGEQSTPVGLGKLYFCRAEDLEKSPAVHPVLLGETVSVKPGMLTCKDDGDEKPYSGTKGFSATFTGTMAEPSEELKKLLCQPSCFDVELQRKLGRMPRKMKKAYRSGHPRNTKWKRKVANYLRRMTITIPDAEIVITREQYDRLSVTISGHKAERED